MSRKKILWLCSWYPGKTEPFNGDFIQRHAIAASLFNDIHVIHVAGDASRSLHQDKEEETNKLGALTEHIIYFKRSLSFWGKLMAYNRWLRLYRKAIKKYISANGRPDLVHVHVPLKSGIAALWMKKKYGTKFLITEHWGIYNDIVPDKYPNRSRFFKNYTRHIFKAAEVFISASNYLAEGVNRMVTRKEYRIIINVANTELFYHTKTTIPAFRFLHVSNMVPLKNPEGILSAFKRLSAHNPGIELVMAGDTDSGIREYAEKLGLLDRSVFFRGEIPYSQVAREMQLSNCLLLFSNIENSPCVIGEALCCGIPVIATNVGGIPELVNNENGILIEKGIEDDLVNAMQKMIDNYQQFNREKIANAARDKFSYQSVGKQLDDVYKSILSGNKQKTIGNLQKVTVNPVIF